MTGKKAQDAHEAIRPTSLVHTPESLEKYLNKDQLKLYTLIWQRFAASQMTPAIYDTMQSPSRLAAAMACAPTAPASSLPASRRSTPVRYDEEGEGRPAARARRGR